MTVNMAAARVLHRNLPPTGHMRAALRRGRVSRIQGERADRMLYVPEHGTFRLRKPQVSGKRILVEQSSAVQPHT